MGLLGTSFGFTVTWATKPGKNSPFPITSHPIFSLFYQWRSISLQFCIYTLQLVFILSSQSHADVLSDIHSENPFILMAVSSSSPSIAEKFKKPISSFFSSPRLLANFTSKVLCEAESMMSPTSILDSKPFSGFRNPFWSEANSPRTPVGEHKRYYWDKLDSKGLVDALVDDKPGEITSKSQSRMVLFGSQLKIQIPPLPHATLAPSQSPKSGIKVRNSQLGKSASSALEIETSKSPRVFTGCLSATEMEHSEHYTRVISHGPNPRTTHIFDNCIVENGCFDVGCSSSMQNVFLSDHITYPSENFMSACFYCNKNLNQGVDIYMYRGERAFCSRECRYQGMLLEEGMSKLEAEDKGEKIENERLKCRRDAIAGSSTLLWLIKPLYQFISILVGSLSIAFSGVECHFLRFCSFQLSFLESFHYEDKTDSGYLLVAFLEVFCLCQAVGKFCS
ncbi:hypothetical protein VNO77_41625 [Canavalia gladiata]|uniref:FLZ-type domain-containing protein n=1 Tax=Canavalia gladiata TaxID=3824 RepID=A0AAN9K2N8_CANGL